MSSLRVRNLIKRFSVNETESLKLKSEAENQPNNVPTNNTNIAHSSNGNNSNAMESSESDADVTDLERQIESLAQQKTLERTAVATSSGYDAGKTLHDARHGRIY